MSWRASETRALVWWIGDTYTSRSPDVMLSTAPDWRLERIRRPR